MVRLAAVAELFDECQQSYASHRKALMLMNRMHQQHTEEFRAHFMTCLVSVNVLVLGPAGPSSNTMEWCCRA